jgi:hypothetical protein
MQYFRFLQDVLGIRQILLPAAAVQPRVVFLSEGSGFSLDANELFLKMTQAMRLNPDDYVVLHLASQNSLARHREILENASATVSFSDNLSAFVAINLPRLRLLEVSHPEMLLKNPALKKEAWEKLKLVMKLLEVT